MRFVCDVMLGKLAKYLRILGFDAAYAASPAALDRCRAHERRPDPAHAAKGAFPLQRTVRIESEIAREQLQEIKALIKPAISAGRGLRQVHRMQRGA